MFMIFTRSNMSVTLPKPDVLGSIDNSINRSSPWRRVRRGQFRLLAASQQRHRVQSFIACLGPCAELTRVGHGLQTLAEALDPDGATVWSISSGVEITGCTDFPSSVTPTPHRRPTVADCVAAVPTQRLDQRPIFAADQVGQQFADTAN